MREYQKLELEGYPLFEDQSFDLSQPGISVILGLNLNGKTNKASAALPNPNAVGKSLFFSSIKDIAFKAGSSGNVKDKPKRGKSRLHLKVGKQQIEIQRYLSGKSEKFTILQNGKDVTPSSSAEQRARIEKILGRDEETFSVIDYLESGSHLIRSGDTGVRRAFFTNFFNLTYSDRVKKLVESDMDRLRMNAARVQELSQQLESASGAKVSIAGLRQEIEALQARLYKRQRRLQSMRDARDFHAFCTKHSAALALCSGEDREDPLVVNSRIKAGIKALKKQLRAVQELENYRSDLKDYNRAVEKRNEYLEKHNLTDEAIEHAKQRISSVDKALAGVEEQIRDLDKKVATYEERLSSIKEKKAEARASLKSLTPKSDCPRCGQPVTNTHYKKEMQALQADVEKYAEQTEALQAKLDETLQLLEDQRATHKASEKRKEKAEAVIELMQSAPRVARKPTKPEALTDLPADWNEDKAFKDLARLEAKHEKLENLVVICESSSTQYPPLTRWLRGDDALFDEEAYDGLSTAIVEMTQELSHLETKLTSAEEQRAERIKIKSRITELSEGLQDLDALKVLEKAFASNSGVKQVQINAACQELEAQVNSIANYVFPEPYVFEFDLTTQFQILVTRKVGKTEETTDVRKLCGAESAMFDMTLAIALISFLHPNKRSNIMVLDEMDAKFGPHAQDAFLRFLPVLNKIVPHLIVITPKIDVNYGEQVRYYTVVKEGSVSRFVPGRHLSAATLPAEFRKKPRSKKAKE